MANPTINPTPFGSDNAIHTVSGSDFAYFDVEVNDLSSDAEFNITVPAGTVAVDAWMANSGAAPITWNPGGAVTALLTGGAWVPGQVTVGSWSVNVSAGGAVTDQAVILVNSGGPTGSMRIRISNLAGGAVSGQAASGTRTVRVVADPSIMSAAPQFPNVVERTNCTLQGNPQITMGLTAGVVPPELNSLPTVRGVWEKVSSDPTFALTQAPPNATFKVPGVYGDAPFTFRFRAYYDINGNSAFDATEPETNQEVPVTFKAVRHRMVVVMDRSGSMGGTLPGSAETKWIASKRAAHIWLDLFAAFRAEADQTAGFITFEDGSCGYPAPASAADVTFRNPANGAAAAGLTPLSSFTGLNSLNLGDPQTCTPIGDALNRAFTALEATPLTDLDAATILLLTDGYENSGAISIKSTLPAGTSFIGTHLSASLKSKLALYVIGCGQSVDEDALNNLPGIANLDLVPGGYYRLAPAVQDLFPGFAQMMSNSIDATDIGAVLDGSLTFATCATNAGETRLALVVPWDQPGHNLKLSRRAPGDMAWIDVSFDANVTQVKREMHAMVTVKNIGTLVGTGPSGALAHEWRIQWMNNGAPPVAQNLKFGVLAVLDLHCKMEVEFDKTAYRTGESIKVTARINAGNEVVTNATVIAEVAGPGEGLGTFMSNNGSQLGGPITLANLKEGRLAEALGAASHGPDANQPKAALFQYYLGVHGLDALPTVNPLFVDGTDRLFDDGAHSDGPPNDGVYANVFNKTDKEGTYTFRFRAEGTLSDDSAFRRVITISKWVGVHVDPASSPLTFTAVANPPAGMLGQLVVVTPKSNKGEFFGPFREGQVRIEASAGSFSGPVESRLDGSYERTLLYKRGEKAEIKVTVDGTVIEQPGGKNKGCLGALIALINKLLGKK